MAKCFNCKKTVPEQFITLPVLLNGGSQNVALHYCSASCQQEIKHFVSFNNGHYKHYIYIALTALAAVMAISILSIFYKHLYVQVLPWMLLAIAVPLFIYPTATWLTYRLLGIKYTRLLVRILALVLIVQGIILMVPR